MNFWTLLVVTVLHLALAGGWAWPIWQAAQTRHQTLRELEGERETLNTRLKDLPAMEARLGTAFDAFLAAQSLEEGERFHRLASALTEWSDLAEVDLLGLRSMENSGERLALEAEVKGSPDRVIRWIELAERAQPPLILTNLTIRRVATDVVASIALETPPAQHFQSPPTPLKRLGPVDPFRKDP